MTANQLVVQLEHATNELLSAAETDLDRVGKVLECRAAVLARIASFHPGEFSSQELASLRASVRNGEAALEKLTLLRRNTAAGWHRLNHVRASTAEPTRSTVSLAG